MFTDGMYRRKTGSLYLAMPEAGATKITLNYIKNDNVCSYRLFFLWIQEVLNSCGKAAIRVRATEALLYLGTKVHRQ